MQSVLSLLENSPLNTSLVLQRNPEGCLYFALEQTPKLKLFPKSVSSGACVLLLGWQQHKGLWSWLPAQSAAGTLHFQNSTLWKQKLSFTSWNPLDSSGLPLFGFVCKRFQSMCRTRITCFSIWNQWNPFPRCSVGSVGRAAPSTSWFDYRGVILAMEPLRTMQLPGIWEAYKIAGLSSRTGGNY